MNSTEISFYLLDHAVNQGKLTLTCRLANKAYRLGHSVYIHTPNDEISVILDKLLWTFNQSSFVPHSRLAQLESGDSNFPVAIGEQQPPESWNNVLISLLDDVPLYYSSFKRVIESVDHDEQDKARARKRFKEYRLQGYQPSTHHLSL